jgi:hypothetical protein
MDQAIAMSRTFATHARRSIAVLRNGPARAFLVVLKAASVTLSRVRLVI